MKIIVLVDIISHLLIGLFITSIFWPYIGSLSLIVILLILLYLIYAWMNADLIVARKAGFRNPTPVQRQYLEYLGIGQTVFTHPSILPLATTLASSKRRSILVSSTVFRELSDDDLINLITRLSSIDKSLIFGWTFHLATGGARLFSRLDRDDPSATWRRNIIVTGLATGLSSIFIAVVVAATIGSVMGNPIDISFIVPVFWFPFIYLAFRFVWRQVNYALIKPAAKSWNKPLKFTEVIFEPLSQKLGGHPNLNLLRHGLLIANKNRSLAEKPLI